MKLKITVPGKPQPGGSKKAFSIKGRDGKYHARVVENNEKVLPWKDSVIAAVNRAVPEQGWTKTMQPVRMDVWFYMPRRTCHWSKKGGLKKTAPKYHSVKPDRTKLLRALEDAITESGLVWVDDGNVVTGQISKLYANDSGWTGAVVCICTMDEFFEKT